MFWRPWLTHGAKKYLKSTDGMTLNTVIWTLISVETPFCQSFSQICYTTAFAATNSTGLSDLLSARGLAHCGCQLPHALAHVACCCFLSVGIHICSPPHNSIKFPLQLVGGVCLLVNEGIQYAVTK